MAPTLNDYFKLRIELRLAQFPDDMVADTGREVELRALQGLPCTPQQIAWLIEAAQRAEPKVHGVTVSDSLRPKEGIG
jgi:hypothetical protein